MPNLSDERVFELISKGQSQAYAARVRTVNSDSGMMIARVYLLHNVTEKRQKERLKSELFGVLSHELKTPLQSLGTASELLYARRETLEENSKLLVDTISEDVGRIRAVANDFFQFAQGETRSLRLKFEPIDLTESLPAWLKPFRVIAKERELTLDYEQVSKGAIVASIDRIKFPWVISNLLSNAIRVSPRGSHIGVVLRSNAGKIEVSVTDEGTGIPPEIKARIYEPYYQGPDVTEKAGGFLGIGLTIAKEVMEAHQGSVVIKDRQPQGTEFTVILPVVHHSA